LPGGGHPHMNWPPALRRLLGGAGGMTGTNRVAKADVDADAVRQ
jgi:hypothetical protein